MRLFDTTTFHYMEQELGMLHRRIAELQKYLSQVYRTHPDLEWLDQPLFQIHLAARAVTQQAKRLDDCLKRVNKGN